MTATDNKKKLMDIGKSVADLARELHSEIPNGATVKSIYTMIENMVYGRDYYPRYAMYLNTQYGFKFERPAHLRPARELLKQAA